MIQIVSIVLLLLDSALVMIVMKNKQFHLLLKLFWAISFLGWNAIPFLLSLLSQYRRSINVNYDFYLDCCCINFFFLFIVYLSAYSFSKIRWDLKDVFVRPSYQYNPRFIRMITNVSIIVLIIIIIIGLGNTNTYAERNDVSNHDANLLLGTISFLRGYSVYFLLAILFFFNKLIPRAQLYLIIFILSVHYIIVVLTGSRIHMFAIVIMLLYLALIRKETKYVIIIAVLGLFSFSALPIISELRQTGNSYTIVDVINQQSKEKGDVVWEVMNKTNSVHSSSILLYYSGIGNGGSLVYTSTLYSLIPRFIYPNKPHPGSMDGTMDGLPSRMAANINSKNYSAIANVGISTSLESLWAGGVIMYFIQALFSGFLIVLMNMALKGRKLLHLYFVLSLLSFPVCMIDVSIVHFSVSIQRFLVFSVLFYILFAGHFKKYRRQNSTCMKC